MNMRMKKNQIRIGTYYLQPYARSEDHVRDLAQCGIDFVIGVERDGKLLDLLERYQVGAIVNRVVPGWFGGNGANAGTMAEKNPLEAYETAARSFQDHPAIWGIDIGDEPSCLDFPHYGRVAELVERAFPKQFAYLNLYAGYGMVASAGTEQAALELGTGDYSHYLKEYCRCVQLDYLCFDHYMFTTGHDRLINDLRTAATVAGAYGRELWVVLQVNSLDPQVYLSEDQLYLQAFTALAFGARCISWACYTPGWWHNHVLDRNGQKTEQYEKLKRVNAGIHSLSDVYMRYRTEQTLWLKAGEECRNWGCFQQIRIGEGGSVLLGLLADALGGEDRAIFLAAGQTGDVRLCLKTDRRLLFRDGVTVTGLEPDSNGMVELAISCCRGGILAEV